MQIPLWLTIILAMSSGVVGSALTTAFTVWWQRRTWVADNKKKEWRELIDVLSQQRALVTSPSPGNAWTVINRTLEDRIFISRSLDENGIQDKWMAFSDLLHDGDFPAAYTTFRNLQREVRQLCRKDLGVDSGVWETLRKLGSEDGTS